MKSLSRCVYMKTLFLMLYNVFSDSKKYFNLFFFDIYKILVNGKNICKNHFL